MKSKKARRAGRKAVVLLSGGLDSAVTLYYAKNAGYKCLCLGFDYGQRHLRELECAKELCRRAKAEFQLIKFAMPWKGSALLDKKIGVTSHLPAGRQARSQVISRKVTSLEISFFARFPQFF